MRVRWTLLLAAAVVGTGRGPVRAEDRFFDSAGTKIRYVTSGAGEPVILIHGFAVPNLETMWIGNAFMAPAILPELAKHNMVVAFDCRGHGKSGKPRDAASYGPEMSEDVIRLMDHLKIAKAHVVGYSMGSMIGLKLLVDHPDRLLSMTLGGGGGVYKPDAMFLNTADELIGSLDQGKGIGPLLLAIAPADRPKPTPVQAGLSSAMILAGQDQKALANVIRGIIKLEASEARLRANKVPTLIVFGSRDEAAIRTINRIQGVLAHSRLKVIEGGDHVSTISMPAFRQSIQAFLQAQRKS